MALNYCPNCGTKVIPPAKFCQNCGIKLESSKSDCSTEEIPSFSKIEDGDTTEVFDEPIEIVNDSSDSESVEKEKKCDNSDLSQEAQKKSDSITETISNVVNNSELSGSSSGQKAIQIQNQASEVSQSGRASAYFFFDLRNELNLGNYDLQNDEFLKVYSKYFPDMTLNDLQQLRELAIPWLNDPNTCNSQYQIIMQDSFEHRYFMITNAWFERAFGFEPTQRAQFVYNTCASFFFPQELQTVSQRLQGLQQTAANQISNINDSFDISCFMNNIQTLPNAKEIEEYVQAFNIHNPGIFTNEIIEQLSKTAYIEKMYGNAKKEAIRKISEYFGISYHENSALQNSEKKQSQLSTENSSTYIGEKTNIKKEEEKVEIKNSENNNSKNKPAIIQCPVCGREVSNKALSCPGCGHPIASMQKSGEVAIKIGIIKAKNTIQYDQDVVIKDKQGNLLWEGKAGDIARFTVDEPLQIEIDYLFKSFILYSYWAATGYGEIDPEKSKKYNVSTNYRGIVWGVAVIMQAVDIFDSD